VQNTLANTSLGEKAEHNGTSIHRRAIGGQYGGGVGEKKGLWPKINLSGRVLVGSGTLARKSHWDRAGREIETAECHSSEPNIS